MKMDKTALLHRRLYRALLRQGAAFDKNPAAKLLLYRKHTLLRNKQDRLNETAGYYQLVLLRLLFRADGRRLLEPEAAVNTSIQELVRAEYRKDRLLSVSDADVDDETGAGDEEEDEDEEEAYAVADTLPDLDTDTGTGTGTGTDAHMHTPNSEGKESNSRLHSRSYDPDVATSSDAASPWRDHPHPSYSSSVRIDAAFALLRKMSAVWRVFRASMLEAGAGVGAGAGAGAGATSAEAASVHKHKHKHAPAPAATPLPAPSSLCASLAPALQPGVLLAAHPLVKGPLSRAVVLLLEHSDTHGSYGLVINASTNHHLGTAISNLPEDIVAAFGECPVSFGGMVRRLQYLHDVPSVAVPAEGSAAADAVASRGSSGGGDGGSFKIPFCSKPFYCGGEVSLAMQAAAADPAVVNRFHFYVGCCTWFPQQLQTELAQGYWIPIQAPADVAIQLQRQWTAAQQQHDEQHDAYLSTEGQVELRVARKGQIEHAAVKEAAEPTLTSMPAQCSPSTPAATATPTAAAPATGVAKSLSQSATVPLPLPLTPAQFQALQARTAMWPLLMSLLPAAHQHCAALPVWLHAGTVDAMDWK